MQLEYHINSSEDVMATVWLLKSIFMNMKEN